MKNKENPVWIVRGHSESGDNYGPKRYDHEPTPDDLRNFIKNETPEELDCGGEGDFNSYVDLEVFLLK
jgi:hypothetical protein